MFKIMSVLMFSVLSFSVVTKAAECGSEWRGLQGKLGCSLIPKLGELNVPFAAGIPVPVKIRAGYLPENPHVPFQGNVLYFEGFGDSMLNHKPLFTSLQNAGYRVIAFDYMGQGGSEGSMDMMKISRIVNLGEDIFKEFAREGGSKTIIGWSTGGLAAYLAAYKKLADKVVLIAPAIVPRLLVGETSLRSLQFSEITLNTLTRNTDSNVHVEGIRPSSPLKASMFAANLIGTSVLARNWEISDEVRVLVLLSGANDAYVNPVRTMSVIQENVANYKIVEFPGSRHEIDNELPGVAIKARAEILSFLGEP